MRVVPAHGPSKPQGAVQAQSPVSGSGTWQVGHFDPSTPAGVILSFSDGSQAELQLERDGSSLAMFYDLGDPDEGWSGQYRFLKQ